METNPDLQSEICEHIRSGRMNFKLHAFLASQAVTQVTRELHSQAPMTPWQAYEFLRDHARQATEAALSKRVQASPYLPALLHSQTDDPDKWLREAALPPTITALTELRTQFLRLYGFPVITSEAMGQLTEAFANRQVLEVGAGNGYLTKQLQDAGIDVFPTDPHQPKSSGYPLGKTQHTAIIQCDASQAIQEFSDMDLLWSWPVREETSGLALQQFKGEIFAYIGEQDDGCTGGELFHQILEDEFKIVRSIHIPSFPNVHDSIGIYQRNQPTRRRP